MCWLSGSLTCRLPNVMRSPPARRSLVSSVTVDWCLAPRRWGFYLKSKSTNYPDHGHHGDPPPHMENPHGRAGNRSRDLVISSQKLWPLDHEAGRNCSMNKTPLCVFVAAGVGLYLTILASCDVWITVYEGEVCFWFFVFAWRYGVKEKQPVRGNIQPRTLYKPPPAGKNFPSLTVSFP